MRPATPSDGIRPGAVPPHAYKDLIDAVQDYAIFFLDPTGHVASWNEGARRLKGYHAAEILGKHFSVFYTEPDIAAGKPTLELDVATRDGRYEDEGWRLRSDGTRFWANVVVTALRSPDGARVLGFAKITRDVTARVRHEEALRQSEERYRLLVESVKDYAIFMLDPEGHVVSWNEGARRLKGYEADQIIGRHFRAFYAREEQERGHPEENLQKALSAGRFEEEGWRYRKDGTRFWANVTIAPLYSADRRLRGFAKVTRDLTERKRNEDDLRRRATQVAILNRELETFAYTVAHDLRAPLRAVMHLTSIVLHDGQVDDESRKTLHAVASSAERMSALVENLLNLSRSTTGALHLGRVDVSRLAEEACAEAARAFPGTKHHVQAGMTAEADANLVRIALDNLVRNAFKFSGRASTPFVAVGMEEQDGERVFFVRDNGIGFDQADATDLFAPFHRLRSASSFEGSGIGLATVRRIVERHGGRVWALSEVGKGATFYFTLAPK